MSSEALFIEDQQDFEALQVAAISAADVDEVAEVEAEPETVQYTTKARERDYLDAATTVTTIEEILVVSSKDSVNVVAFKSCMNELVCRQNCSPEKYTIVRRTRSGESQHFSSLPSLADFTADVLLCGKRSMAQKLYDVLVDAVETDFAFWDEVPAGIQRTIAERTGKLLLERRIFSEKSGTREYWYEGLSKRGKPSAPPSFRLV